MWVRTCVWVNPRTPVNGVFSHSHSLLIKHSLRPLLLPDYFTLHRTWKSRTDWKTLLQVLNKQHQEWRWRLEKDHMLKRLTSHVNNLTFHCLVFGFLLNVHSLPLSPSMSCGQIQQKVILLTAAVFIGQSHTVQRGNTTTGTSNTSNICIQLQLTGSPLCRSTEPLEVHAP